MFQIKRIVALLCVSCVVKHTWIPVRWIYILFTYTDKWQVLCDSYEKMKLLIPLIIFLISWKTYGTSSDLINNVFEPLLTSPSSLVHVDESFVHLAMILTNVAGKTKHQENIKIEFLKDSCKRTGFPRGLWRNNTIFIGDLRKKQNFLGT